MRAGTARHPWALARGAMVAAYWHCTASAEHPGHEGAAHQSSGDTESRGGFMEHRRLTSTWQSSRLRAIAVCSLVARPSHASSTREDEDSRQGNGEREKLSKLQVPFIKTILCCASPHHSFSRLGPRAPCHHPWRRHGLQLPPSCSSSWVHHFFLSFAIYLSLLPGEDHNLHLAHVWDLVKTAPFSG